MMMMMMVISETFMEHLFDILRTVHLDIFLYLNQREALISQIYFWNGTLHVSESFCVHHQESSVVSLSIIRSLTLYTQQYIHCTHMLFVQC